MKNGYTETVSWSSDPNMWLAIRMESLYSPTSKPSTIRQEVEDLWTSMVDRYTIVPEVGIEPIHTIDNVDYMYCLDSKLLSKLDYAELLKLTNELASFAKEHSITFIFNQYKSWKDSEYSKLDIDSFQMTTLKARQLDPQPS